MPSLRDPIHDLSGAEARALLQDVRAILWPEDDPAIDWSSDQLDDVARLFELLRLPTVSCALCRKDAHAHRARRHQGANVGPCCWDERLRTTE